MNELSRKDLCAVVQFEQRQLCQHIASTLRCYDVALGRFIQHNCGRVHIKLRPTRSPPFARDELVGGYEDVAADVGSQVAGDRCFKI